MRIDDGSTKDLGNRKKEKWVPLRIWDVKSKGPGNGAQWQKRGGNAGDGSGFWLWWKVDGGLFTEREARETSRLESGEDEVSCFGVNQSGLPTIPHPELLVSLPAHIFFLLPSPLVEILSIL